MPAPSNTQSSVMTYQRTTATHLASQAGIVGTDVLKDAVLQKALEAGVVTLETVKKAKNEDPSSPGFWQTPTGVALMSAVRLLVENEQLQQSVAAQQQSMSQLQERVESALKAQEAQQAREAHYQKALDKEGSEKQPAKKEKEGTLAKTLEEMLKKAGEYSQQIVGHMTKLAATTKRLQQAQVQQAQIQSLSTALTQLAQVLGATPTVMKQVIAAAKQGPTLKAGQTIITPVDSLNHTFKTLRIGVGDDRELSGTQILKAIALLNLFQAPALKAMVEAFDSMDDLDVLSAQTTRTITSLDRVRGETQAALDKSKGDFNALSTLINLKAPRTSAPTAEQPVDKAAAQRVATPTPATSSGSRVQEDEEFKQAAGPAIPTYGSGNQ